ncbi:hypothetical protein TrCOL_g13223 [Triparma columacea]|uniref:Rhodanese domain-containing protein n=1 Tax=Triparma columacea TaxID=722753 RepID=A0A9W7G6E5_9STRA|nr:hypothetical protein TrCOL_g13223 [Triparma columacea]
MSLLSRVNKFASVLPNSRASFARFSSLGGIPVVDSPTLYSHLQASNDSKFVTVDVRPMEEIRATYGRPIDAYLEPEELSSEEAIKYVHLDEITSGEWLESSPEDFEEEFNFPHPLHNNNKTIVFICRGGVRSKLACEVARQQGVGNVANYLEGAAGWDFWWSK